MWFLFFNGRSYENSLTVLKDFAFRHVERLQSVGKDVVFFFNNQYFDRSKYSYDMILTSNYTESATIQLLQINFGEDPLNKTKLFRCHWKCALLRQKLNSKMLPLHPAYCYIKLVDITRTLWTYFPHLLFRSVTVFSIEKLYLSSLNSIVVESTKGCGDDWKCIVCWPTDGH